MMQNPGSLGKDWRGWLASHWRGLKGVLWGVVGLLVGALIMRLVEIRIWSGMPAAPAPEFETRKVETARPKPFSEYQATLDRNLLQVAVTRPAPEIEAAAKAEAEAAASAPPKPSALPAEVLGTLGGDDEVAAALIRDKRNKEVEVYLVGDKLFGEALIVAIRRGEVEVLKGNRREILTLYDGDAPPPAPEPTAEAEHSEPMLDQPVRETPELIVSESGENAWEIDKESFDAVLHDLGPLLTQARVVPNFKGGKIDGYKVFAIKKGSLFEKIGLSNGDVIRSVNGVGINTPERALQLFQQLRAETEFRIDIERDGASKTFSYTLR